MAGEKIMKAININKIYQRGSEKVKAVNGISLDISRGEFVAFVGPSGSGKTTLINILGCLDNPTSGELTIDGKKIFHEGNKLSEKDLTKIRRELFGYIFQSFYLIPTLTVAENIMLPRLFYKQKGSESDVKSIMERLGIHERACHLPKQISGGEMQRVAIARALINNPEIILADEPTGNLDTKRSYEIVDMLRDVNKTEKKTVIMVTHNLDLAKMADRTIELRDGKIVIN